ncbi:spore gernimation protein [Paenibacillus sp. Marseille-P2973]|uniref:spore germination lipoprotein GerD n=1 Tax=unclassified Paenibacillus TaxID=185978 RepID=UPI001B37F478|nr:spore germination lipoprotein GerD [Paenibacillus sp. Marseille-P2973]MBQ4901759.1 spore gernimation protein [Paenibacillus sp. Marseille-P2973]
MKRLGYRWFVCILCLFTLPLAACGSEQSASSSQGGGGYKDTKSMVIDILKTDDGKKAIYEALSGSSGGGQGGSSSGSGSSSDSGSDSESESGSGGSGESGGSGGSGGGSGGGGFGIKMILPGQSSEQIRMAVKETITAPEYKKELEKIMTDPQFAGDFAKAVNSQSKQMHMELIKDPTYQKSVSEIMKSPEVMKMFLDLTKTSDFRKQSMTVMQEAMQSPLFKMEVMELLKTVVQEQLQPKVEKSPKAGEGEGGQEGGNQEGGGGGQGSGGGGSS